MNGRTQIPDKKVPKKLKSLLDSTDLDLVQLGATLMTKIIPKERWGNILTAFQLDSDSYNELWLKKWNFEIEGEDIIIKPLIDLWRLHARISTPLLSLKDPTKIIKLSNNIPHFKFSRPNE